MSAFVQYALCCMDQPCRLWANEDKACFSPAESSENQKTSDNVSEGAKKEPSTELPRHLSVTSPEESNATAPRATSFDWSTIRVSHH